MRHIFLGLLLVVAAVAATFIAAAVLQQRVANRLAAPEPLPALQPQVERPFSRPLGEPRRGRPYIPAPDDVQAGRRSFSPFNVVLSASPPAID